MDMWFAVFDVKFILATNEQVNIQIEFTATFWGNKELSVTSNDGID